MEPFRIRIERIIDFGPVVSLVGTDLESDVVVSVHIDHRPLPVVENAFRDAGLAPVIEYEAHRLVLHVRPLPTANTNRLQLLELGGMRPGASSNDDQTLRELDR